jgi:hypothetical protein
MPPSLEVPMLVGRVTPRTGWITRPWPPHGGTIGCVRGREHGRTRRGVVWAGVAGTGSAAFMAYTKKPLQPGLAAGGSGGGGGGGADAPPVSREGVPTLRHAFSPLGPNPSGSASAPWWARLRATVRRGPDGHLRSADVPGHRAGSPPPTRAGPEQPGDREASRRNRQDRPQGDPVAPGSRDPCSTAPFTRSRS